LGGIAPLALYSVSNKVRKMTTGDSSDLGMAFGSAGATIVFMCVPNQSKVWGFCEKTVELFLKGARRRLAG